MNYSSQEKEEIITYFTVLTSSSRDVARSFLETHQWDLYAAASTFNGNQDTVVATAEPNVPNPNDEPIILRDQTPFQNLQINIPDSSSLSPSQPSRAQHFLSSKRTADTPCESQRIKRRQGAGNIHTLAYLTGESDTDEPQEYKGREDNRATDRPEQSSRSLSGETVSAELQEQQQDQPDDVMTSIVTLWRNGFTIGDGPFRSSDDPENAACLESIKQMNSAGGTYVVKVTHVIKLIRRGEENFSESSAFQGVGRTLAGSDSVSREPPLTTTPPLSMGLLVVDPEAPTTSIQLRFADGTSLVTLFNTHHTIRDVRGFIDASRPDGSRDYQLLIMGFPPKPLSDLDQTIDKAGIADSVLIQKF